MLICLSCTAQSPPDSHLKQTCQSPLHTTHTTMSPRKSEVFKQSLLPSATLLPPDMTGHPGKSSPLGQQFANFSMVGVYQSRSGPKFGHITSERLLGKFTVLIFMDNKLTDLEAEEWKNFSDKMADFKKAGVKVMTLLSFPPPVQVMGVCTDSHITIMTMLTTSPLLQGITFPIISDRDGDFSRAFGVLKLEDGKFMAARAVLVLDPAAQLVHVSLRNERTRARPGDVLRRVQGLQRTYSSTISSYTTPSTPSTLSNFSTISRSGSSKSGGKIKDVKVPEEKKEGKDAKESKSFTTSHHSAPSTPSDTSSSSSSGSAKKMMTSKEVNDIKLPVEKETMTNNTPASTSSSFSTTSRSGSSKNGGEIKDIKAHDEKKESKHTKKSYSSTKSNHTAPSTPLATSDSSITSFVKTRPGSSKNGGEIKEAKEVKVPEEMKESKDVKDSAKIRTPVGSNIGK